MADMLSAFCYVLENEDISGPVNFSAPHPVRNKKLAGTLGSILGRPSFLKAPSFMIKLALGEAGAILLEGSRIITAKLLSHGFQFHYPDLEPALRDIVKEQG